MRLLLLVSGICAAIVAVGTRAQAQNYPWCAQHSDGTGSKNCGFATFQQCLADVSGVGGFCTQNRAGSGGRDSHYCLFLAAAGGAGRTSPHGSGFFFSGTETPLTVDWYARSSSLSFFFSWSVRKELVYPGNPRLSVWAEAAPIVRITISVA
jgi:hypothetical protein